MKTSASCGLFRPNPSAATANNLRHMPGRCMVLAVVLAIPLWALIISVFVWIAR